MFDVKNAREMLKFIDNKKEIKRILGLRKKDIKEISKGIEKDSGVKNFYCGECGSSGIKVSKNEMDNINEVIYRTEDNHDIMQFQVSIESLAKRAKYLIRENNLQDKKILFVGDNDMTSLALCKIMRHNNLKLPKKITVVDIDKKLLNRIEKISKKENFFIKTIEYDINCIEEKFPKIPEHDVFFTDPPFTIQGTLAFVYLGLNSLKNNGRGYVAIPSTKFLRWSKKLNYNLQKFLLSSGFLIREMITSFHEYEDDGAFPSSMIELCRYSKKEVKLPIKIENIYSKDVNAK